MHDYQSTRFDRHLATAEILYHLPDYPGILQSFVWQHMDVAPDYPRLRRFLEYWTENIEARLHSVTVSRAVERRSGGVRHVRASMRLH